MTAIGPLARLRFWCRGGRRQVGRADQHGGLLGERDREHDERARSALRCTPDARRSDTHRRDAGDAPEHPDLSRRAPRCPSPAGTRRAGGPAPHPVAGRHDLGCRTDRNPATRPPPGPCPRPRRSGPRAPSHPARPARQRAAAPGQRPHPARAAGRASGIATTSAPRSTSSGVASRTRSRISGA